VVRKIDRDQNRFKQIVRGKIKADLRKYISHGEMIGKTGGELVSIPLPQIDIPEFRYGAKNSGGVGQGPGDVGTPIGRAPDGDGPGQAGDSPGHHILEVELTLDELAQILGEGLELPRIEPKGRANIIEEKDKYTGIRQAGPRASATSSAPTRRPEAPDRLEHLQPRRPDGHPGPRGQALPLVEPGAPAALQRRDPLPDGRLGSMTDDQKEIVRIEAFWIDTWLKSQYDGVTTRYIIHDAVAKEVDQHTFYHTRESGGTRISSAYTLANKIIDADHPPSTGTSTSCTSPTATTGARTTASASACCATRSCRSATCSATARSRAPTARASSTASWRRPSTTSRTWRLSQIRNKDAIFDSIKVFLGRGR
jgi:uncharacterized sporulation protein YeaH/YhbH (DUF444 family)